MIRVTVWNEYYHEQNDEAVKAVYPEGIHGCLAGFLAGKDMTVRTATLDEPDCGLPQEVLDETDVLIWWGHKRHGDVPDEVVQRVQKAVLSGMGAIFLHSAHYSKPFRALMGTSCTLNWREDGDRERIWAVDPSHPIVQDLPPYFVLPREETYGEPFGIPEPDKLVFLAGYEGGEVFRAGCCWRRGNGKVFYFQPGHETFPTYRIPEVQTVLRNAVRWCQPVIRAARKNVHVQRPQD